MDKLNTIYTAVAYSAPSLLVASLLASPDLTICCLVVSAVAASRRVAGGAVTALDRRLAQIRAERLTVRQRATSARIWPAVRMICLKQVIKRAEMSR